MKIQLDIVNLENKIFSGSVDMVVVSGKIGELGICPGHAPLLTSIKPGQIRVIISDIAQEIYYVSGGIMEVQPANVTILADTVVRADNLDEAAAVIARKNAEQMLINKNARVDYANVLLQLAQAAAQLRTISSRDQKKSNNKF
jgi:F-type H+-transporting ATPase subunit epsilon